MPGGPTLCAPPPGTRFYSLARTDNAAAATREISWEIRALMADELSAAVEAVLRSITAHAALTEAVLETHVVRLADPSVTPARLAETLALQLSEAGLRASFGPSWTPTPDADVSVGTGGLEDTFENVLMAHSTWRPSLQGL